MLGSWCPASLGTSSALAGGRRAAGKSRQPETARLQRRDPGRQLGGARALEVFSASCSLISQWPSLPTGAPQKERVFERRRRVSVHRAGGETWERVLQQLPSPAMARAGAKKHPSTGSCSAHSPPRPPAKEHPTQGGAPRLQGPRPPAFFFFFCKSHPLQHVPHRPRLRPGAPPLGWSPPKSSFQQSSTTTPAPPRASSTPGLECFLPAPGLQLEATKKKKNSTVGLRGKCKSSTYIFRCKYSLGEIQAGFWNCARFPPPLFFPAWISLDHTPL